ncbi:MAG: hypothetical protein ACJ0DI_06135 [bacterium]
MTRKKGARQKLYSVSSNRKLQKSKDWIPLSNNTLTNVFDRIEEMLEKILKRMD